MNDTLYARWLSGELTEQEIADLKASGEWDELQTLIDEMDKLTLPKYNKDVAFERLKSTQIKQEVKPEAKIRRLNIRPLLAVAASLLLVLAIAFLWRQNRSIEVLAAAGKNEIHQFKDQSSVTLNDGSGIVYQPAKWSKERLVQLTGEGLFAVSEGAPFKVTTQHGTVEVLGTSFNVRAWGERLYVECYTGKVRVTANGKSTTLTPTQSVSVIDGKMQSTQKITHQKPLWSTGSSHFNGENLKYVFEEFERQFNMKIIAPANLNETFNGTFNHDSPEIALRQVCTPMGYFYDISGNEVIIKKKNN